VACNAINTFDNADGAAGGLVAVALLARAPLLAAPVLAFLPFNLRSQRSPAGRGRDAAAYLGDSGSHLLGMLVLLTPAAWPALVLPLADLARLSVVRVREGAAPWVGDRRHLAHRLGAAGLSAPRVVAALLGIAAPTLLLGWVGAVPTALFFAGALRRTPPPPPPDGGRRAASSACSDPRPAR
jgi:UDP-GlcNAc:undecaprenyl-phosphate GlcNAc-1-phosphate transferase